MTHRWVTEVVAALSPLADPERAVAMRAYMKDIAPFLGIAAPVRRAAVKPLVLPSDDELLPACRELYALGTREHVYVAVDAIRKRAKHLPATALVEIKTLIQTNSWWDAIDGLAPSVGAIVRAHDGAEAEMEEWIEHDDFWVQRAAILHQLGAGVKTDEARLFRLCLRRANSTEFFIRKGIGWALRDYAWTYPEAVRTFVENHRNEFSNLTVREALKNVDHPKAGKLRVT